MYCKCATVFGVECDFLVGQSVISVIKFRSNVDMMAMNIKKYLNFVFFEYATVKYT